MHTDITKVAVLIPALDPDEKLPQYLDALEEAGFCHMLIIDDGSHADRQPIFDAIEKRATCRVLHHDVNRGKGAALKTGYRDLMEHAPGIQWVLTADSDGQHTAADCLKVCEAAFAGQDALYLGSRDFSLDFIPPKSRFGNRCTSAVFKLLYGTWLPDTQTGLRVFSASHLPMMIETAGERYEYEMNVLIACSRKKLPMIPVTIETIYENNNEGTHFHPIRDSYRIYKVILGNFIRFIASSLVCVLIDQAAAALLAEWLLPLLGMTDRTTILWVSGFAARLISACCNFYINKQLVFSLKQHTGRAAVKYALLCILIICLSNAGVSLLTALGAARWIAKLLCDTLLSIVSYRLQRSWVFQEVET